MSSREIRHWRAQLAFAAFLKEDEERRRKIRSREWIYRNVRKYLYENRPRR
jgi:hypothetical protein